MSEGNQEATTPQQRFNDAFRVVDEARQKVLAFLDSVSQGDSERRLGSDKWSIGEVAEHLILVERSYCSRILGIVNSGEEADLDENEMMDNRPFALEDVADVGKVGKAQAPPPVQPSGGLSIEELCKHLVQVREETRSKLSPFSDRDLGKLYYQHRRLGPLSVYEQISFIGFHELKHLAQMQGCLSRTKESPD